MRPFLSLALAATLCSGLALAVQAAPPPGAVGSDGRPAPPPAYGEPRPTPPSGRDEASGPIEAARRTAIGALERFDELHADLDRADDQAARDAIEIRMMEIMGEALETLHRNVSPRQGAAAERIYRIVEPAYKKAWLQRYEWKQEQRSERKRQRLRTLNLHLRDTLRDVRSTAGSW